jgi:predicted Zn-dependent protease
MNYLKRDDLEAARGYAERAVKAGGDDFATHLAEGRVLLATGDAAGAARELEAAVKQAPRSPAAHFSLAEAYRQLGRKTDAAHELAEFQNLKKAPKP